MVSLTSGAGSAEHYRDLASRSHQVRRIKAIERRIRELLDARPPLTDSQRDGLVTLLQGGERLR